LTVHHYLIEVKVRQLPISVEPSVNSGTLPLTEPQLNIKDLAPTVAVTNWKWPSCRLCSSVWVLYKALW